MAADAQAALEHYQKISGKLEDLTTANELQQKRIAELEGQLRELRDAQGKADPNAVSRDELRQLAAKVKEIDEKRAADKELILGEIAKLAKTPASVPGKISKPKPEAKLDAKPDAAPDAAGGKYEGYEYVVKEGDTLSKIVAAYREKGVKITSAQILKHPLNMKVDANKLRVGQKIFIPDSSGK